MEECRETRQGDKVGAVGMDGLLSFELDLKTCIVAERKTSLKARRSAEKISSNLECLVV
jgi:hypothetical protein